MKIKDYKCKCGHDDFFFADKGNQKGIYCSYCGKWLKWADKDEKNLAIMQIHVASILSNAHYEEFKQLVEQGGLLRIDPNYKVPGNLFEKE